MEEITGRLESVGSSTIVNNSRNVYNTFEIGGRMLQKISAARSMDDMLRDCLGEEITIWTLGGSIIALRRSDGRSYAMKEMKKPGIGSLILGIVLIPAWGIGLLFLLGRHIANKELRERSRLRAELPNATILQY